LTSVQIKSIQVCVKLVLKVK